MEVSLSHLLEDNTWLEDGNNNVLIQKHKHCFLNVPADNFFIISE